MLKFKKDTIDREITAINQQIQGIIQNLQTDHTKTDSFQLSSQHEKLQSLTSSLNALIQAYDKNYEDLHTKHEIVTRLNNIGTWDGVVQDGAMKNDDYNDYNGSFRQQLGYENEQDFPSTLGSWYTTISDEDFDLVTESYGNLFEYDTPYDIEYRAKSKDNSLEWVHVRAEVLRNEKDEVIRHIGTLRNIHKEKSDELEVQKLLERLELIETSLKMSTNNVEGAWGMDFQKTENDDEKYWFSPQFISLLGYSNKDYFEPSVNTWMDLILEDSVVKQFNDFLSNDNPDIEVDFRMKTIKGEEKWFQMTLQVERDMSGNPLQLSGVLRDIQQNVERAAETDTVGLDMKDFTQALDNLATQVQKISQEASDISEVNHQTVQTSNTAKEKLEDTKKVTDLIKNISDQTNLLGINASIEASLSGEEGNGFHVIAKEIVNLSSETTHAVAEVDEILEEVTDAVLGIASSIEEITEKIDKQAAFSEESSEATKIINEKATNLLQSIENLK